MIHRVKLIKQGLFRHDQLNYVERTAKANDIDLDKMTIKELIDFCELHSKIFINRQRPDDDNFDAHLKNSKWKVDKPQEPRPL